MSLSYRVTFLCNVFVQIHYTSESPVRFLFYEKSCKVVYIITKGKKNILNLLGQEDTEHLTYKAVDEIEASGNLFFAVYKVSRSVK